MVLLLFCFVFLLQMGVNCLNMDEGDRWDETKCWKLEYSDYEKYVYNDGCYFDDYFNHYHEDCDHDMEDCELFYLEWDFGDKCTKIMFDEDGEVWMEPANEPKASCMNVAEKTDYSGII